MNAMFDLVTSSEVNYCGRKQFSNSLNSSEGKILEIAPLDSPFVKTANTFYFDVLPKEDLQKKAIKLGRDPSKVPDIHFHHPNGDLSIIGLKFDAIFSSHCIEHTPDIVSHLKMVSRLLNDNGEYFLFVPDKKYTFDYFKPVSQAIATTFLLGPKDFAISIAPTTFIPVEVPEKIPSSIANLFAITLASVSSIAMD